MEEEKGTGNTSKEKKKNGRIIKKEKERKWSRQTNHSDDDGKRAGELAGGGEHGESAVLVGGQADGHVDRPAQDRRVDVHDATGA